MCKLVGFKRKIVGFVQWIRFCYVKFILCWFQEICLGFDAFSSSAPTPHPRPRNVLKLLSIQQSSTKRNLTPLQSSWMVDGFFLFGLCMLIVVLIVHPPSTFMWEDMILFTPTHSGLNGKKVKTLWATVLQLLARTTST